MSRPQRAQKPTGTGQYRRILDEGPNDSARPSFLKRITALMGGRSITRQDAKLSENFGQYPEEPPKELVGIASSAKRRNVSRSPGNTENYLTSSPDESEYYSFPNFKRLSSSGSLALLSTLCPERCPPVLPKTDVDHHAGKRRHSWVSSYSISNAQTSQEERLFIPRVSSVPHLDTAPDGLRLSVTEIQRPPTRGSKIISKEVERGANYNIASSTGKHRLGCHCDSCKPENALTHGLRPSDLTVTNILPQSDASGNLDFPTLAKSSRKTPHKLWCEVIHNSPTHGGHENVPDTASITAEPGPAKVPPSPTSSQMAKKAFQWLRSTKDRENQVSSTGPPTPAPPSQHSHIVHCCTPSQTHSTSPYSLQTPSHVTNWGLTTTNSFIRRRSKMPIVIRLGHNIPSTIESETEPSSGTETGYFAGSSSSSSDTITGCISEEQSSTPSHEPSIPVNETGSSSSYGQGPVRSHTDDPSRVAEGVVGCTEDQTYVPRNKSAVPRIRGGAGHARNAPKYVLSRKRNSSNNILRRRRSNGDVAPRSNNQDSVRPDSIGPGRDPRLRADPNIRVPQHLWFFAGGKPKNPPTVETYRKYYGKKTGRAGDAGLLGKMFGVSNFGFKGTKKESSAVDTPREPNDRSHKKSGLARKLKKILGKKSKSVTSGRGE